MFPPAPSNFSVIVPAWRVRSDLASLFPSFFLSFFLSFSFSFSVLSVSSVVKNLRSCLDLVGVLPSFFLSFLLSFFLCALGVLRGEKSSFLPRHLRSLSGCSVTSVVMLLPFSSLPTSAPSANSKRAERPDFFLRAEFWCVAQTCHSACPERSRRERSGPIFSVAPLFGPSGLSSLCHPDRSNGAFCRCGVEGSRHILQNLALLPLFVLRLLNSGSCFLIADIRSLITFFSAPLRYLYSLS